MVNTVLKINVIGVRIVGNSLINEIGTSSSPSEPDLMLIIEEKTSPSVTLLNANSQVILVVGIGYACGEWGALTDDVDLEITALVKCSKARV